MKPRIHIIGAGWAGLSAAIECAQQGFAVSLYESARQAGGRARRVMFANHKVDNGQHLMIGAYSQMLETFASIDIQQTEVFQRINFDIDVIDASGQRPAFSLKLPRQTYPLHLAMGILICPSLSLTQKITTGLRFNAWLNRSLPQDQSASDWLAQSGLPENFIGQLLMPLCQAALTTRPEVASAQLFQSVLQQTFRAPADNTDMLIPTTDLSDLFPDRALAYLTAQGADIQLGKPLRKIVVEDDQHQLVFHDETITSTASLLATPPWITRDLLAELPGTETSVQQLDSLAYEPITTVYCQYPDHCRMDKPFTGFTHATSEWIFDRHFSGHPGLIAIVLSANGPHSSMDNERLINTIATELKTFFPHWPERPEDAMVIREKRAAFHASPGVQQQRPTCHTPWSGIKLCGDYVNLNEFQQPPLPATLETAIRSGVLSARTLIQGLHS